eukprot:scaffold25403_cov55-Phaeocystis_antarctica.AAC.2
MAAAFFCDRDERGFPRRSSVQRRSPFVVRDRLLELRCRARPLLPSPRCPAQHYRPHRVGSQIAGRRLHNPCR